MTTFVEQIESTLASARALAGLDEVGVDEREGSALGLAIKRVDDAVLSSPLVLPWFDTCSELGAPDAGLLQRLAYDASCGEWEGRVRSALEGLRAALVEAGDPGLAEVAGSLSDQAATMGEQARGTKPQPGDWWANMPTWAKVMLGVVVADRLLNIAARAR